jgi:drug/metabolite transporter (DMT)-like permease
VVLAVVSCLTYGFADYAGAACVQRAPLLVVCRAVAATGLVVELALVPLAGARFAPAAIGWGIAAGAAAATAMALLYRCLATGPMSVLSPVTGVVSAVMPVGAALILGERLDAPHAAGIPLAVGAVALVNTRPGGDRADRQGLLLAVAAGAAIAVQLVCLHQAPHDSGLAPLVTGRATSLLLVTAAAAGAGVRRGAGAARRNGVPVGLALTAGALDALANVAFLLAVRAGLLAVTAVIVALYPAGTLLLARRLLDERLRPAQLGGLAVAVTAVALLTVPS